MFIALAACSLALAAAGCGSQTHHTATKPKPKHTVLVHASLGYGAFHRFILVPARAGHLANPVSPAASQGEAARFAAKELNAAARYVQHSKRLNALFAPLEVTADKIKGLAGMLPRHASLSQIEEIDRILSRIAALAKADGHRIVDASTARIAAAGGPRS